MISLLVPTRNRPDGFRRMRESALDTSDGPVQVCAYFDDDDPTWRQVVHEQTGGTGEQSLGFTWTVGPRRTLSECWNEAYRLADGDILMHASDDIVFRTDGWDTAVRAAFDAIPDRIAFVHGRDGFQDERLGTHGFLHRRWVETVGYFVPPWFVSDYNDLWLDDVARAVGRKVYLPDVLTEHLHPCAGKGELDQTHRERLARHERDDPGALYERMKPEREADAEKLRAVIRGETVAAVPTTTVAPAATRPRGRTSAAQRRIEAARAAETPGNAENGVDGSARGPRPAGGRPRPAPDAPLWSILIATVGQRNASLQRLLADLAPQVDAANDAHPGSVEVVVYWDNFDTAGSLGQVRQRLLDDARGAYVSFVDDDDEVPPYYVDRVLAALAETPDYVGWRQQLYVNGRPDKPTFHSLRYDRWWDDDAGYYRHVSHLNPIRVDLARLGRFDRGPGPEDVDWAHQVHAHLAACRNVVEVFVDEVMYLYRFDPKASVWCPGPARAAGGSYPRPVLPSKAMRFHPSSAVGIGALMDAHA